MGWLARVVVSSMTLVVGCASIANLADSTSSDEQTDGSNGSSGGSGTSGTSGTSGSSGTSGGDAATSQDAAAVGADATQGCTKQQNDQSCNAAAECCSGACATNHKCKESCKTTGGCQPTSSDCCLGQYCSADSFGCVNCKPAGAAADTKVILGFTTILTASCCSGKVDGSGKCAP
jgi:hypothetical protein